MLRTPSFGRDRFIPPDSDLLARSSPRTVRAALTLRLPGAALEVSATATACPRVSADFRPGRPHHPGIFPVRTRRSGQPRELVARTTSTPETLLRPVNKARSHSSTTAAGWPERAARGADQATNLDYDREVEGHSRESTATRSVQLDNPRPRFIYTLPTRASWARGFGGRRALCRIDCGHPSSTVPFPAAAWRAARYHGSSATRLPDVRWDGRPSADDAKGRRCCGASRAAAAPDDRVEVSIVEESQPLGSFLNGDFDIVGVPSSSPRTRLRRALAPCSRKRRPDDATSTRLASSLLHMGSARRRHDGRQVPRERPRLESRRALDPRRSPRQAIFRRSRWSRPGIWGYYPTLPPKTASRPRACQALLDRYGTPTERRRWRTSRRPAPRHRVRARADALRASSTRSCRRT